MTAALLGPILPLPLEAHTRKGDRFLVEGRAHEDKKEWDAAVESYDKALSEDPSELVYQMAAQKARFEAAQAHVENGTRLRDKGQLGEALIEFQRGYVQNPGSSVAGQEILLTQQMIQRERQRILQTGKESAPEARALTPADEIRKQTKDKIDRMLGVPELRPTKGTVDIQMNSQPVKTLYETLGAYAGINVLWDPDYTPLSPPHDRLSVKFQNTTIEQALDYLGVVTKSYWKAISPNTIFITNDNGNKRRDYEDEVTKIFYLQNTAGQQDLTQMVTAVRTIADCNRLFPYESANAIVARCQGDRIALAEKIINDLDKPRSEVVVDVLVIEASTNFTRQISAAIAGTSNGLNMPISFTPRSSIGTVAPAASGTTPAAGATTTTIPLSSIVKVTEQDFSTILPNALLQAALSDTKTRVLQSPQLRTVDGSKASLKIGEREPVAQGSYSPGVGIAGSGVSALVNTQFTFIDVGVNVDLLTHVHENGDVSMNVTVDISSITNTVNLGGVDQPVIGQRKVTHDLRLHEGEVSLIGGLVTTSDSKTATGIPGLSSIPLLGHLFKADSVTRQRDDIMIALIPHIVRRPDITAENLSGVAVGANQTVHIGYAAEPPAPAAPTPPAAASDQPPAVPAPAPAPTAVTQPAVQPATIPTPAVPQAPGTPALLPPATAPPETPAQQGTPPAAAARIHFNQLQVDKNVADRITVGLIVENASDVASAPMQIRFDPKVLKLNDVTRGGFWASDGKEPVFTRNIQNESGTAQIELTRPPGAPGASGVGTLLTLTFEAVGRGTSTIEVPNLALKNSQGQAVGTASPQMTVNIK